VFHDDGKGTLNQSSMNFETLEISPSMSLSIQTSAWQSGLLRGAPLFSILLYNRPSRYKNWG